MTRLELLAASGNDWSDVAANITTVLAALVLGTWAYLRFLGGQLARPRIELRAVPIPLCRVGNAILVHCHITARNLGSRECDLLLYWRILYYDKNEPSVAYIRPENPRFAGQVKFRQAFPQKGYLPERNNRFGRPGPDRYIPYLGRTFIGPQVTQSYDFVTSVPGDSVAVTLMGLVHYQTSTKRDGRRAEERSVGKPAAVSPDQPDRAESIDQFEQARPEPSTEVINDSTARSTGESTLNQMIMSLVLRLSPRETKTLTRNHTCAGVAVIRELPANIEPEILPHDLEDHAD
jgi:hypothetical protein